jgi:7-cyano-7-deazaguanine synthase
MPKSCVVLLSSGLDSAANLVLGRDQFTPRLALTINYGQKSAARETAHAARLAKHFALEHVVFDMSGFSDLVAKQSALLGKGDVPVPTSLDALEVIEKTAAAVWVPNRNGVMLGLAAALAESRRIDAVVVGFNAEEAVTFPDNTPGYMKAMTHSFEYSTANHVKVLSATAEFTKSQIVKQLAELEFPFQLLWSCYHNGATHCGQCESCQRLKRALNDGLSGEQRTRVMSAIFGS